MRIRVLTNVRADSFFLGLWIAHYGGLFGRENLHVMLDGDDWTPECDTSGVHLHVVPDVPRDRKARLNFTSDWQSGMAQRLRKSGAAVVLRTDVDEFVAVDPRTGISLPDYLDRLAPGAMVAALGIDVVHDRATEAALDPARPILSQRRNGVLTREFCKLVAVTGRVRWVPGFHRGRRVPIDIRADLLLFHLALVDRALADRRIAARSAIAEHPTQARHIARRLARFAEIDLTDPVPFDEVADRARAQIMVTPGSPTSLHRGHIRDGNAARGYHVILPDRFASLLPAPGRPPDP